MLDGTSLPLDVGEGKKGVDAITGFLEAHRDTSYLVRYRESSTITPVSFSLSTESNPRTRSVVPSMYDVPALSGNIFTFGLCPAKLRSQRTEVTMPTLPPGAVGEAASPRFWPCVRWKAALERLPLQY